MSERRSSRGGPPPVHGCLFGFGFVLKKLPWLGLQQLGSFYQSDRLCRHGGAIDRTIASSRRCNDSNFLNSLFPAAVLPADIAASRVINKTRCCRRTGSSSALSLAAVSSFRWRPTKSRSKRIREEEPWRSAFIRERALPSRVRGPVLLAALRLLAAICFSEAKLGYSCEERAAAAIACARMARSP